MKSAAQERLEREWGDRYEQDAKDEASAAQDHVTVKYRVYEHGGARFYTENEKDGRRLLADTYKAEATERVAAALNAELQS